MTEPTDEPASGAEPAPRPDPRASEPARAPRLLEHRSVRLSLGVGLGLALLLAGASPLTGVPGPESALVLGIVLPPFVAAAGARLAIAARGRGLGGLLERACCLAACAVGLPSGLLAANGLVRVRWCAPWEGLAFVAMGPGLGALLASVLGVAVGCAVGRPRLATAVAALLPVLALLSSAAILYATPAIFAYGHFFGYFPGTLYDADVAIPTTYVLFRAFTAALLGGLVALVLGTVDPVTVRCSWRAARRAPGRLAVAALCFIAVALGEAAATELGHRSTSASIRARLGSTLRGRICDVVVPRELPRERAERLRDDCDFRAAQAARMLGARQRRRITAFFFRSADEKRELMGASGTYIAKPWRDEIYLQLGAWPHPVLAHEIAHVVAGNVGRGPFRIAGRWGGWMPSPGIIEGVAVALAWEERDGLTPHQWARALMELGWTPSIAETEGLGFLLQPASRAYVASGSFVRWILEQRGAAAVRRLYASGAYEQALGTSLQQAEARWRRWLSREVHLPPEGLAMARARFERAAVFAQVCPHRVAVLRDEVAAWLEAGDEERAVRGCEDLLEIDPGDTTARAWLAVALARAGRIERAQAELARLVGPPSAPRPVVRAARQGIADALWARGRSDEAARMYREILAEPIGDEDARQIEVRLLALESARPDAEQVRELLAPSPERTHDAATAMAAIARLRQERPDGLGPYLEARQMMQRERFDRAAPALREAFARGLPTERIAAEARRMDGVIAFALGEHRRARAIWQTIAADPSISEAARVEARDWLARIEWAEQRR